jgi:hypothetical protein
MEVLHLGVSFRIGLPGGVSLRSLLPLLRFLATSHGGIGIVALRSVLESIPGFFSPVLMPLLPFCWENLNWGVG